MDDLDRVGHLKRKEINTQIMGLLSKFFSNARKPEGMHTYTPEEIRRHLTNVRTFQVLRGR